MDYLEFQTGGFPMSVERLKAMQDCWQSTAAALSAVVDGADGGSYVVTGCGQVKSDSQGSYYDGSTAGWIVVKGELMPFVPGEGKIVAVKEGDIVESVTYQDGLSKPFRRSRHATMQLTGDTGVDAYSICQQGRCPTLAALDAGKASLDSLLDAQKRLDTVEAQLAALDAASSADLTNLMTTLQRQLTPKGSIIMWAGAIPYQATSLEQIQKAMPWGYLPCSAAQTPSATWASWLNYIGYHESKATLNGSTKFTALVVNGQTIPDLSGRFPIGVTSKYTLLTPGGEAAHTLTADEMPRHSHNVTNTQGSSDSKYFALSEDRSGNPDGATDTKAETAQNRNYLRNGYKSQLYAGPVGGGAAHNNMPPYMPLNFLIKAV